MDTHQQVLLLDRNYIADRAISWRKAFDLVMVRGVAEIIIEYNTDAFFAPAVIRLTSRSLANRRKRTPKFFKKILLYRDNFTCVYCGKISRNDLTIDHVLPRSRGGPSTYENCVASCFPCNQWKSNKTPQEAGMRLLYQPTAPTHNSTVFKAQAPVEWQQFISL